MKIREAVFIKKMKAAGYQATGTLEGHGVIRKRGRSMEEAKERFFEACNAMDAGRQSGCRGRARSSRSLERRV